MALRLRNTRLTLRYEDDLRLFRSYHMRVAMAALVIGFALFPIVFNNDFWLSVLTFAGIYAIGAIGLNLLSGYTGQVSLGHAFFLGVGAYTAVWAGRNEVPFLAWLLLAAVVGGLLGAAIGPFALRLRGVYLVIITLGLVFVGLHLFRNWTSLTGGGAGTAVLAGVSIGPLDFNRLELLGSTFTRNQGWFWLVWALVAVAALLAKNMARTRPGRAMQAVRDRDVAASVIGVSLVRYKVAAFAVSSMYAAAAGGLLGTFRQFVAPQQWDLLLSIEFIAIIILGGLGTIFGAILGAVFIRGVGNLVEQFSHHLPFVAGTAAGDGVITVFALNQIIYGLLIILFLVFEPLGLAALWLRLKAYFKAWPFSY